MKWPLKMKTAFGIACIAFMLTAVAIGLSYSVYVRTMDEHYALLAQNVADTAALGIDGDKIQLYYDSFLTLDQNAPDFQERLQSIKDEEYHKMLNYLYGVRRTNDVLYLYVEVLDFDKMTDTYIMDADESGTGCELGYTEMLPEDMRGDADTLNQGIPPGFTNTAEFGPLVTSGRPIYDSEGRVAALAVVDISMQKIWADRQSYLIMITCLMLFIALALAAIFAGITNRLIVRPINCLAQATSTYISDKEQSADSQSAIEQLDIRTGDEIENLCLVVKKMEREINEYLANLTAVTAEKERIGAELGVATHIQASMLPCIFPAFPGRAEFDIYATMQPAKEVGGDFYDFFLVDDNHLAMVMADVSGKGVPAALFMVIAKTLIKNIAQTGLGPKEVLEKANNQLCENNEAEMFVTVWLGILEISTGKMICANAGHEFPTIQRVNGDFELIRDKHGFVLAGMEGSKYREYELALNKGDRLFVYTDGVAEATNAAEELYGTDRMIGALNRSKSSSCGALLHHMKEDIDLFVGDAPQFDDITMLTLEMRGKSE